MHSVLFIGEALDGPVGKPHIVDWTNQSSINQALQFFGEAVYEAATLSPSGTNLTTTYTPWTAEASFVYFDTKYKNVPLPRVTINGLGFEFETPPLTETKDGWIVYRKLPTDTDLTWALRRAVDQNSLTPSIYDTCGLLRVVASDAIRATGSIGTLTFTASSPGPVSNNIQLLIGSSGLTIIPPPSISLQKTTYLFTQESTQKKGINYKYLYQLVEAIQQDALAGIIPLGVFNTSKLNTTAECWAFGNTYEGLSSLSSGSLGSAVTIDDIWSTLEGVDVSDYEVVAFCGRYGRDIFPDVEENLFKVYTGFPYQILCASSGSDDTLPFVSKDDSYGDRWISHRFSLINGKVEYGSLLSATGDILPSYAVILTSRASWHGLGTRAPIAGKTIASNDEKDSLASVGVVTIDTNKNIPVIYKGTTTDIDVSSVGIACLRGVCRGLFPTLYDTIGINTSEVLSVASDLLERALLNAKANGCPILDYDAQAVIVGQTLTLRMTLDIAGEIEAISAQIAVPIGR